MMNNNALKITGETRPTRNWYWLLLSLLGWGIIGTIWSTYFYFRSVMVGDAVAYHRHLVSGFVIFSFWMLATPIILKLAKRFPLHSKTWQRHAFIHALLAPLFLLLHVAWTVLAAPTTFSLFGWDTWSAYWANVTLVDLLFNARGPVDIIIYWSLILGYLGFNYYRQYRERDLRTSQLETQLAEAQLAGLRMHLQPHFLFNTLHSIVALIQRDNKEGAIKMAVGLSDLLRRLIAESGRHEATLREEISFLSRYLEIEQTRFQDRLTVSVNIDPKVESAYIPILLLQPLVENALRHGIATHVGPGTIEISARHENGGLLIEVRDYAVGGMNQSSVAGSGVGLKITRERLHYMYGSNWEFSLNTENGRGTCARIRLPYQTEPQFKQEQDAVESTHQDNSRR